MRDCALLLLLVCFACAPRPDVLTFSGSVLGAEGEIVRLQIDRFAAAHPGLTIEMRPTPDAADQRHQLYVQWLNAWSADPDVLQLDVVWTPEFAAAGWILPLDAFGDGQDDDFFRAAREANRWNGRLYARPWFVDVGMLYWRTDLMKEAPSTFDALTASARAAIESGRAADGFVWQGARYEGLITVFLEHLAGFGGRILDERGEVVVDSDAGVRALTFMRDAIHRDGLVPRAVLTWQEEQTRFAFQNGRAVFMRNWPYAAALLRRAGESSVAGTFAVAPMPHADGGVSAAALGGAQLAINARSRQPDAAWALVRYLTAPEQMIERARVAGQFPARRSVYDDPAMQEALSIPPREARAIIDRAVPRPVTPVYTQLSGILQIHVHRALTLQEEPGAALRTAARAMRELLASAGLQRSAS
jgi:multiple sugar transport system substrate-binding protein